MTASRSDALVLFGVTGDLAHKMIFPALYAMAKQGALTVPVIGVARPNWSAARLHERVADSIKRSGGIDDQRALDHLLSGLGYVSGDYNDQDTFTAIKKALGAARRPAHYLAIPPSLFETVIKALGASKLNQHARVIVEKPFGRDLTSARKLNRVAQMVFPKNSIFCIDHFLGKEAIMNMLYFRFANSFLEPIWNRNYAASVQVTLSEDFGVEDRGAFYETAGCLRDVIAFLSGGQSGELASARLNAMNVRFKSRLPWALAFSYARAIQQPALEILRGENAHVSAAQRALYHRAACNRAARRGEDTAAMESN